MTAAAIPRPVSHLAPRLPSAPFRRHLRLMEPALQSNREHVDPHRTVEGHLERLRSFAATRPAPPVFCHWSAAIVHGMPLLADPPASIHTLSLRGLGTAAAGVVSHPAVAAAEPVEVRGLLVTDAARTAADLAGRTSFLQGVVAADRAIAHHRPLTSSGALQAAAERVRDPHERVRARAVAAFADPRAESPLESLSRAAMALAGAPAPEFQTPVDDLLGFHVRLDFFWPRLGLVGEADGGAKYRHPAFLRDRTGWEVLAAQSERQRRIEALGLRVIRWGWPTAIRVDRMRQFLASEGVPVGEPRTGWPG